jgi:hypothetical protein
MGESKRRDLCQAGEGEEMAGPYMGDNLMLEAPRRVNKPGR